MHGVVCNTDSYDKSLRTASLTVIFSKMRGGASIAEWHDLRVEMSAVTPNQRLLSLRLHRSGIASSPDRKLLT